MSTELVDAALAWHDAGASVLGAAIDGSKRPAVPWQTYQHARPTREQVEGWAQAADGIGLICGAVSGNLEMTELEGAAVADGLHLVLRDMFHEAGVIDLWAKLNTYVEMSPSGGLHWIYRVDGPVPGNTKLARRRVDGKIQVLAETRGEGGWVVIAPSAGRTHPTGKAWRLVPPSAPGGVPVLTVDEHQTLHRLAASLDELGAENVTNAAREMFAAPGSTFAEPGQVSPGDDFAAKTDWADILVPAGWRLVFARGAVRYWRRPGKKVGISATTGYGDHDLLYVFTSSTEFDPETSYSKLAAFALLNGYGRDYSGAARELRSRGFGSKPVRESPHSAVSGTRPLPERPERPASAPPEPAPVSSPSASVFDAPGAATAVALPVEEDHPSWAPIDPTAFIDGTYEPQKPTIMARVDGVHLLYPAAVHSFAGESESGKSWLGLHAMAERLKAGEFVAMIDYESTPAVVFRRLLLMGVPGEALRERFHYLRPEVDPSTLAREHLAFEELLSRSYAVVVLDGVTEALGTFAVPSKDNDEVSKWVRAIPRRIAHETGAALVLIDHVVKDSEARGRFAIGAQAKLAALDGAAYMVEVIEPLGVGMVGRLSMRVAKDRPGEIRPHAGAYRKGDRTQEAAVVLVDSSQPGRTAITVQEPRTAEAAAEDGKNKGKGFQPTGYMQRVSKVLEAAGAALSKNAIVDAVGGNRTHIYAAIVELTQDGFIAADGPAVRGYPTIRSIKPFREES